MSAAAEPTRSESALDAVHKLGYDPAEGSDCTVPDQLDLRDKSQLLQWKYLEGGHRLPRYIPTIPHVDETEVIPSIVRDEETHLELGRQLVGVAKQIQSEFVYTKQRFDLLQQERDLLKWHLASNSKTLKIKEAHAAGTELRARLLEQRLKDVQSVSDRLDRERSALSSSYKKAEANLEESIKKYEEVRNEMEEWLSRRGDFLADTTIERRKADHERRLRYRQWKKLAHACAVDKKWHVRIGATRNADAMVYDAYESVVRMLQKEFEKAGEITGPIRQAMAERGLLETDPFEAFEAERREGRI